MGSNLAQGKGFGSGALQGVGKAAITPGSGIGAGAELAGNLLQKSDNPLAQNIGKGLDVASNFAPGGGGVAGAVGNLAQNFLGQAHGGGIPHNPDLAGAPYKMRGVKLMKAGGTIDYDNGGKPGEIPGFDMTTRKTMRSFDVEGQKPVMDETRQIYIDGLPVSAKQAKAFMDERAEGMEGQVSASLGDAMEAATARRVRERSGRDYLGPGMYRPKATEELQAAQKRQGASGLLGALEGYDTSRGTRNYGGGGYLR